MVVSADPRCSSNHSDNCDDDTEDTPRKHGGRSVVSAAVLERTDDGVDEPRDTRGGTPRMDTAKMLKETGQEDTNRQRRPLSRGASARERSSETLEIAMRRLCRCSPFGRHAQGANTRST